MSNGGVDVDAERVGDDAGRHGLNEVVDSGLLDLSGMDLVRDEVEGDAGFADVVVRRGPGEEPIRSTGDVGPPGA